MDFEYNHYYEIYNSGSGKYVNLSGDHEDGIVSNGEKVTMYARTNNPDQRWALERYGSDYRVRIVLQRGDGWYALNYNTSTAGCIVWHLNSAADSDTVITLEPVVSFGGLYRLKLPAHNAYLTVVGSELKWLPYTGDGDQYFLFVEPGSNPGGGGSGEHRIKLPYYYNQKDGPTAGFRNTGCAVTCGMAMTSFYSGKYYSFEVFEPYYDDYTASYPNAPYVSYSWGTPEGYTFAVDYNPSSLNEANTIAYIKRYIDQGTPVACHCLKVTKNEHWVIPIEYTSGSGWDSITVFDPYKGVRRSMAEAMNISCGGTSSGVDRIRCHPNHMLG